MGGLLAAKIAALMESVNAYRRAFADSAVKYTIFRCLFFRKDEKTHEFNNY